MRKDIETPGGTRNLHRSGKIDAVDGIDRDERTVRTANTTTKIPAAVGGNRLLRVDLSKSVRWLGGSSDGWRSEVMRPPA